MDRKEVVRLITAYTGGYPKRRFWSLTGSARRSVRTHIMSTILGRKATQKESGITAIREALLLEYKINTKQCIAAMEEDLFITMGI